MTDNPRLDVRPLGRLIDSKPRVEAQKVAQCKWELLQTRLIRAGIFKSDALLAVEVVKEWYQDCRGNL